jgi:uncharacterized protein
VHLPRGGHLLLLLTLLAFPTAISLKRSFGQAASPAASLLRQQLSTGKAFNKGIDRPVDYSAAFKCFQAASSGGSVEATAWLGSLYLFGHGVSSDVNRARQLIQGAADRSDPVGLRLLGLMYQDGQGFPLSYATAAELYAKAIDQQDGRANVLLARLILHGTGVPKDYTRALALLNRGVGLNDAEAQFELGLLYERGMVRDRSRFTLKLSKPEPIGNQFLSNESKAIQLYLASAANGNRVAAYRAGRLFENGVGTTKDEQKAFEYYWLSAQRQYPLAQYALARAFELGIGTTIDPVRAYALYSLASQQGSTEATSALAALTKKLSQEQIEKALVVLSKPSTRRSGPDDAIAVCGSGN